MNTTEIRHRLEQRQEKLRQRLVRIVDDVRDRPGFEPDFEEQATAAENDEVLGNLEEAIRLELRQIETSLNRLKSGNYLTCEACHKPISERRLEAQPYATRCVACEAGVHSQKA